MAITAPLDPDGWADNFICGSLGGTAYTDGVTPLPNPGSNCQWICTTLNEEAEPASHGWANNKLCHKKCSLLESCYDFQFSEAGPLPGKACLQLIEPFDPDTWSDNYVCWTDPNCGANN